MDNPAHITRGRPVAVEMYDERSGQEDQAPKRRACRVGPLVASSLPLIPGGSERSFSIIELCRLDSGVRPSMATVRRPQDVCVLPQRPHPAGQAPTM